MLYIQMTKVSYLFFWSYHHVPLSRFSATISPSDGFSLDSAWIFPFPSANYSLSKSHDGSSPAVNNFLLSPRSYSLEKDTTFFLNSTFTCLSTSLVLEILSSDQDSAEDRKGVKQHLFVFLFGFWLNLVKFLGKSLSCHSFWFSFPQKCR